MQVDDKVLELIDQLQQKYNKSGQDMKAYLEGLLHANFLNYWDYVHVDTLLTLQKPRTQINDEMIFIIYHQITELYFKLILHEMHQISDLKGVIEADFFQRRLKRMNSYFRNLTRSFEIMVDGMEKEQFLQFRMSLLPASGFQSAQYRMIEICACEFGNLIDKGSLEKAAAVNSLEEKFEFIYWKAGATELATGKKTLTLTQFEEKYSLELVKTANEFSQKNIWAVYKAMPETAQKNEALVNELKLFDQNVNVIWPLVHYKSAVRYLQRSPEDIAATGGTNWQKYLPPRFQKRIFYRELWTDTEIEEWGKQGLFGE